MVQALNRIRVALNVSSMTDAELLQLIVAITALAPQSSLIGIAANATSVSAVTIKGATFKAADEAVTADEERLRNDKVAKGTARGAVESEVTSLAGLVGNNAKTPADVAGMAFAVRAPVVVASATPAVPESLDVTMPKKGHGRCKVSVHETGTTHGRYVAEWSPDPIGANTWTSLPGTGKSRTITGASGTKVWVQFARVRGQLQSAWCTPVLVTIPRWGTSPSLRRAGRRRGSPAFVFRGGGDGGGAGEEGRAKLSHHRIERVGHDARPCPRPAPRPCSTTSRGTLRAPATHA